MVTQTEAIAHRVDADRRAQGVAVLPLSEATGIPRTTLTRFLAGKGDLKVSHIYLIARELKANPASWFTDLPQVAA